MFVIFEILHKRTNLNKNTKVQICSTREDVHTVADMLQNTPNVVAFTVISHKPSELGWTNHTLKNWSKHRLSGYGFTKEDFAASDDPVLVKLDESVAIDKHNQ